MNLDNEHIDPMEYDILLELATRIEGEYVAWAREVKGTPEEEYWWSQHAHIMALARSVDSGNPQEIRNVKEKLRTIWNNLPADRPQLVA
ncbi:hypothetical protein [Arcanobacterium canis]